MKAILFSYRSGHINAFKCNMLSVSEFQREGTTTEKARVPAWVLTLGKENKWKPDEWSSLSLGDKDGMENKYEGSLEESVWYAIVQSLKMMQGWTGTSEKISGVGPNGKNRGDHLTTLAKQLWTHWRFRISLDVML